VSPENTIRLEILRSAPLDKWIALSGDESRLIAVGDDYSEVSQKADAAGETDAVILKTPSVWSSFSV
jgi:hypothetical protein